MEIFVYLPFSIEFFLKSRFYRMVFSPPMHHLPPALGGEPLQLVAALVLGALVVFVSCRATPQRLARLLPPSTSS